MYKIIALILFLSCAGLMCQGCGEEPDDSSSKDFTSNYLEAQAIHECVHECTVLGVGLDEDCYDECTLEICPNGVNYGGQLDREIMCN